MLSKEQIKTALDKAQRDMEDYRKEHPLDEWELSAWLNLANARFTPNRDSLTLAKAKALEKKVKEKKK